MGKMIFTISALSLIIGLFMLSLPQMLVGGLFNRIVVSLDKVVVKYHVGVGICLILASIFLFSYGYYLGWR